MKTFKASSSRRISELELEFGTSVFLSRPTCLLHIGLGRLMTTREEGTLTLFSLNAAYAFFTVCLR